MLDFIQDSLILDNVREELSKANLSTDSIQKILDSYEDISGSITEDASVDKTDDSDNENNR